MICSRLSKVKQSNLSLRADRLKHSDKYVLIEAAKHKVNACENLRIKFENDV
jgi:hypothetical protein